MQSIVSLATKHGKLAQIEPAFSALAEWKIELVELDTDEFGTFAGEVPRRLSPKETVIAKARAGAMSSGADYGIASEGTIGPHPAFPFVTADHELLAFVCLSKNFAIVESHVSTEIVAHSQSLDGNFVMDELVQKLDLPNHAANLVVGSQGRTEYFKGIREAVELEELIIEHSKFGDLKLRVESDYRAMNSPSRQANIAACAVKLARRVASLCPACKEIGWGLIGYEYGVECGGCGLTVSSVAKSEKLGCVACENTELVDLNVGAVDPSRCDFCNP